MVWLPDGEKRLMICLAASTGYRRVTDTQTSASVDIAVRPSLPAGCSTSVCSLSSSQSTRDIKNFAAQFLLSLSSSSSMTLSRVSCVKRIGV